MALLTIGVGTTVVMADVIDRLLLRTPAHVDRPDLVRRVYEYGDDARRSSEMVTNYATMERLAAGIRDDVAWVATFWNERIGIGRGPDARRLEAVAFGEAYFDVLGLTPRLGVLPSARRPDPDGVVISHGLWQQQFGGAPDVVGRPMRIGPRTHTIVAVAPRGFAGIDTAPVDVWVPLEARVRMVDWRTQTGYYLLRVIVRLREGIDRPRAEAHATQVYNAVHRVETVGGQKPYYRILFGELPPARKPGGTHEVRTMLAVSGVSAFVLLIACGNVGNLLLVRGLRRAPELALKTALGATRGRLLREILVEAILLGLAAGIGALIVVLTVGGGVRRFFLPPLAATAVSIDARLLGLTIAICLGSTLLLGLAPALRLTTRRTLTPGRAPRGGRPSRLLDGFVAIQVTLSVPLLLGTGLFAASLWNAHQVSFGMETTRVAIVETNLLEEGGSPAEEHRAHRRIQERIARVPGVQSVALAQTVPMVGVYATWFFVPEQPNVGGEAPFANAVDPAFLDVLGLRVVAGRGFTPAENTAAARPVTMVNEAMAAKFWPGRSAVGRCIHVNGPTNPCAEVVGVVANTSMWPYPHLAADGMKPVVLMPIERFGDLFPERALLVRTTGHPQALLARLRQEAQAAGADLPYIDVWAFDDVFQPALRPLRLGAYVFLALSTLALVIAIAGLAVVTTHGVTRRTREMGIRLVLGADPADLVRLMLRRTLAAVCAGIAAGGVLAYAGSGLLRTFLFGIEPGDPRVFAASSIVLFAVGVAATYVPARRAGRIEPSEALRTE